MQPTADRRRRALLAALPAACLCPTQLWAQSSAAWLADIDAFLRELRARHLAPFEITPAAQIEAAAERVRQHVQAGRDALIAAAFQEMVGLVGDFHTQVNLPELQTPRLPLVLRRYAEGWFVVRVAPGWEEWLGRRIYSLADLAVDAVQDACRGLAAYPLSAEFEALFERVLQGSGSVLAYCSLLTEGQVALGWSPGLAKVYSEALVPLLSTSPSVDEVTAGLRPALISERQASRNYYAEPLPNAQAVYFGYRRCVSDPAYPPSRFSSDLLALAREVNAQSVLIDLRGNGGGDSALLNALLAGVSGDAAIRRAQAFVLTDARTQSSALMNAHVLRSEAGAISVGSIPGTALNHLGEVRSLSLPSGRTMFYSTRRFNLAPQDPRGRAAAFQIDRPVQARWLDAQLGLDTLVESAIV